MSKQVLEGQVWEFHEDGSVLALEILSDLSTEEFETYTTSVVEVVRSHPFCCDPEVSGEQSTISRRRDSGAMVWSLGRRRYDLEATQPAPRPQEGEAE